MFTFIFCLGKVRVRCVRVSSVKNKTSNFKKDKIKLNLIDYEVQRAKRFPRVCNSNITQRLGGER